MTSVCFGLGSITLPINQLLLASRFIRILHCFSLLPMILKGKERGTLWLPCLFFNVLRLQLFPAEPWMRLSLLSNFLNCLFATSSPNLISGDLRPVHTFCLLPSYYFLALSSLHALTLSLCRCLESSLFKLISESFLSLCSVAHLYMSVLQ